MITPISEEGRRCLLIAMPQLSDPNFHQTTTLLTEFTKEGAHGVILNRPLDVMLSQVLGGEIKVETDAPLPVYWGGPVQTERGLVVHESSEFAKESLELVSGLYLSGSGEVLKQLVEREPNPDTGRFRLFLGYAGWSPGQLEDEIASSSWVTAPLDRSLIFDTDHETLWRRSLAKIGVDPIHLTATPQTEAN